MRQFCLQARKTRHADCRRAFCRRRIASIKMSDPKTSQPVTIDSLEFAHDGKRLSGVVSVAEMSRLADSAADRKGKLAYTLLGGQDAKDRPVLHVHVEGDLTLRCQRCLGALPYRLAVDSQLLVLTPRSAQAAEDLEDLDGIPADPRTDVVALLEDEVLLALPMAPRHAEGVCELKAETKHAEASPFAALGQLKRN